MADDNKSRKVMVWEAGKMMPAAPPIGMYRRTDGMVLVRWERSTSLLTRDTYLTYQGYGSHPAYEDLPSEAEWELQWIPNGPEDKSGLPE